MKTFKTCFYASVLLSALMCSCKSSDDNCAKSFVDRISSAMASQSVDSLTKIGDELLQIEDGADLRSRIFVLTADSSSVLRAMSLILTHNPDCVADSLMAHPSTELAEDVAYSYRLLKRDADYRKMTQRAQDKFSSMSPAEQARFVSSFMKPEECAAAMEPGDEALIEALQKHYASSPDDLQKFNNALNTPQS